MNAQKPFLVSASLMCMDLLHVADQLVVLDPLCDMYHIDMMDGNYVPNITLSPDFVRAIRPVVQKPIDIHLMTYDLDTFIPACAAAGADCISVHAEMIRKNAFRTISSIRAAGCKVGVVLSPSDGVELLDYYIDQLDKITVMTVDPGFAGQAFIERMTEKIQRLADLKREKGYRYIIESDGCNNISTYAKTHAAGIEQLVMGGSGLFGNDPDVTKAWALMLRDMERALA